MSRSQWCQQFHASSQVMSLFVFVFVIVFVIFYSSLWSNVLEVTSICLFHCLHLSFFYQIRSEKDFERYVALQKIIKKNYLSCNWGEKQQWANTAGWYICAFFSGDANFLCHAREKLMQTPSPTVCSPQSLINNIVFTVFLVLLQIFMCSYLTRPPHVMYSWRPCLLSDNHRRHTTASAHWPMCNGWIVYLIEPLFFILHRFGIGTSSDSLFAEIRVYIYLVHFLTLCRFFDQNLQLEFLQCWIAFFCRYWVL